MGGAGIVSVMPLPEPRLRGNAVFTFLTRRAASFVDVVVDNILTIHSEHLAYYRRPYEHNYAMMDISDVICHWFDPIDSATMNTTVSLDKAGRIVIPKTLRDELNLEPGDALALESEGDRVTLRPVRTSTPLRKERGVWVFRSGKRLSATLPDEKLRDIRHQSDRHNRGTSR